MTYRKYNMCSNLLTYTIIDTIYSKVIHSKNINKLNMTLLGDDKKITKIKNINKNKKVNKPIKKYIK